MMRIIRLVIVCLTILNVENAAFTQPQLRVIVVGLNHDHVHGILQEYKKQHVDIVGIVEPSTALREKYSRSYTLPDSIFYDDLKTAVSKQKPDAVLGYNAVNNHVNIVETCAPLGVAVMVEKPLAATLTQAKRIESLAKQYHIAVLTNYETTWYPSCRHVFNLVAQDSIGPIKKMVAHDGHQGPKEIGCSEEFLAWLTDPVGNGAGAINDFGCYGSILMTWLMKGERPIAVTAVARHYKQEIYPKVEDDASIIVEYRQATGLIEASWNWPFSIKDLEVFGEHGYLHAADARNVFVRMRENRQSSLLAPPLPEAISSQLDYLATFIHGKQEEKNDMCSLKYNMIMMEILDAAKRSAQSGTRVTL
jgi:predicted dehydrogenase